MIYPVKIRRTYITLFLFLVLALACSQEQTSEQRLRPVRYEFIDLLSSQQTNVYSGVARSDQEINLSFRISGVLTSLNMTNGKEVRKGDLLAHLDNTENQLSLEQAKSTLNSARAELFTAEANLSRTRSLYEQGISALSDYENSKSAYASAKANFESAENSVGIQKKQLSYGTIYSPTNGVIANRDVELNENISAGQVIAVLNAGQSMEVSLGLPENMINVVLLDMEVKVEFSSFQDQVFSGFVSEISPSLDVDASTYPIRISLLGNTKMLRSGMSATVSFTFDANQGGTEKIVAPTNAVGEDDQGRFVYLVLPENDSVAVVKKQYIKIGALWNEGFEVESGVELGDRVATAGLQTLLNNQKVRLY